LPLLPPLASLLLALQAPADGPASDSPPEAITGLRPLVERADAGRADRLAAQRRELEELLAAMASYGRQDEWIGECKRRYLEWDAAHPGESGHVVVGEWTLTTALLRAISLAKASKSAELRAPREDGTYSLLLTLVDYERQFAARGIDFLVVLVPSKLAVHPEIVLPEFPADGFAGMGETVVRQLLDASQEGVETLSLTAPFAAARHGAGGPLYLKSDPHWTTRGAELCAEHVARRVAAYPWFRPGALKEGRHFTLREGEVRYSAGSELAVKGARDEVMQGRAVLAAGRDAREGEPFDAVEPKSPILVFGDSYARVHHEQGADFVTHLARFLGRRVDCLFAANGGQREVRQKLARREEGDWKGKRLAIWLLPEQLAIAPVRIDPIELFAEAGG
jgi:hypothetical protein